MNTVVDANCRGRRTWFVFRSAVYGLFFLSLFLLFVFIKQPSGTRYAHAHASQHTIITILLLSLLSLSPPRRSSNVSGVFGASVRRTENIMTVWDLKHSRYVIIIITTTPAYYIYRISMRIKIFENIIIYYCT